VAAVVVRLNVATWVVRVSMECVEVGADTFYGSEVLLECQLVHDLVLKVTVEDEGGAVHMVVQDERRWDIPVLLQRQSPEPC